MSRLAVRMVRLRRAGELAASRAEALGESVCAAGGAFVCRREETSVCKNLGQVSR